MGVSFGYFTSKPLTIHDHKQLLLCVSEANKNYEWWCESVWISEAPASDGNAFGFTKLFRMIDDEDVDTYMAYLDICEIAKILCGVSKSLGVDWRLEIDGSPFGQIINCEQDDGLRQNLSTFLELFGGDFTRLKSRSRPDVLAEWADR